MDQIVAKLRKADVELGKGKKVPEICKLLEVTEQTYYRWRQKYGGMKPEIARCSGTGQKMFGDVRGRCSGTGHAQDVRGQAMHKMFGQDVRGQAMHKEMLAMGLARNMACPLA